MGDFGPNIERIGNVDGSMYERITYPDGRVEMRMLEPPHSSAARHFDGTLSEMYDTYYTKPREWTDFTHTDWNHWSMADYDEMRRYFESKEENKVNVVRKKSYNKGEHIVACCDEKDLSTENILKTLSAVKGKLMLDVSPIHIQKIECSITPQVRQNIVTASKRLKMYGKKRPIIARFDEFGNRLPDEIDIGTSQGITLKIVDPDKYGKYYFELKGVEFPEMGYEFKTDHLEDMFSVDPDDLPF